MENLDQLFKVKVNLSKNEDYLIITDEKKQKVIVNVNLVKHCLGIPYTKKDGTHKSIDDIEQDKISAKIAYVEAATRNEGSSQEPIL